MSDDDRRLSISTHGNTTTILGFRQTGKTQTALELAMEDAASGRAVFFRTAFSPARDDAFKRAAKMAEHRDDVSKVWLANGEQRVEFDSGGVLRFHHRRGDHVDKQVMDDVVYPIFVTTTRIIKTRTPARPKPPHMAEDET